MVIVAFSALALISCDMCGNEVVKEVVSPSGTYKAVLFERDCGATTSDSTQIAILEAGKSLPNRSGNIFSADSNHGIASVGSHGTMNVAISWKSDHQLEINDPAAARVFSQMAEYHDIRIAYKTE